VDGPQRRPDFQLGLAIGRVAPMSPRARTVLSRDFVLEKAFAVKFRRNW
jgi:hypothetical protein